LAVVYPTRQLVHTEFSTPSPAVVLYEPAEHAVQWALAAVP